MRPLKEEFFGGVRSSCSLHVVNIWDPSVFHISQWFHISKHPSCRLFLFSSHETYTIGFVVPNQKHFLALADQFGIRGSIEELCSSKAMEELVLKTITEAALAGETSSKRS